MSVWAVGVLLGSMSGGCAESGTPAGRGELVTGDFGSGQGTPAAPSGNAGLGPSSDTVPDVGSGAAGSGPGAGPDALGGSETPSSNALPPGEQPLPCEVGEVVIRSCQGCHGARTNWGAPMRLVSHGDFMLDAPITRTSKVHEVAALRIHDEAAPMPPGRELMPEADRAVLDAWFAAGSPPGDANDAACIAQLPPPPVLTMEQPTTPIRQDAVCYQFLTHGAPSPDDTSPQSVATGESYVNFYYSVPWQEPSVMLNFSTVYDRTEVLHHWLLYETASALPFGTIEPAIGSHIGDSATLIAGWAVGGNDVELPEGITGRVPDPGAKILIEWHLYNTTGSVVRDRSGAELCVVQRSSVDPKKISGVTWLGTENFNSIFGMPPGVESKFEGTCNPLRRGLGPDEPITIFAWLPHMHLLGRHMETWINRSNGTRELVFSEPFQFDRQISHSIEPPYLQVHPGDTVTARCTFFNNTERGVPFGPSTTQEMCYQFAFHYPAGALDNGVPSLVGATNTCW